MRVDVLINWEDGSNMWTATSGAVQLAVEDASLTSLKKRIPPLVAKLSGLPVEDLDIVTLEGKHPSGYRFDSKEDWQRWESRKDFTDEGWEGPRGDLSKTDLKKAR